MGVAAGLFLKDQPSHSKCVLSYCQILSDVFPLVDTQHSAALTDGCFCSCHLCVLGWNVWASWQPGHQTSWQLAIWLGLGVVDRGWQSAAMCFSPWIPSHGELAQTESCPSKSWYVNQGGPRPIHIKPSLSQPYDPNCCPELVMLKDYLS